jgi:hypothetical protein
MELHERLGHVQSVDRNELRTPTALPVHWSCVNEVTIEAKASRVAAATRESLTAYTKNS